MSDLVTDKNKYFQFLLLICPDLVPILYCLKVGNYGLYLSMRLLLQPNYSVSRGLLSCRHESSRNKAIRQEIQIIRDTDWFQAVQICFSLFSLFTTLIVFSFIKKHFSLVFKKRAKTFRDSHIWKLHE